jgi:hypothetical protein
MMQVRQEAHGSVHLSTAKAIIFLFSYHINIDDAEVKHW